MATTSSQDRVIIDSPAEPRPVAVSGSGEPVRPKAFRRPPGWLAPAGSPQASKPTFTTAPRPASTTLPALIEPPKERLYGLFLLLLLIGVNLLAAGLLQAWQPRMKPRYGDSVGGPYIQATGTTPRDSVTLYTTPGEERRALRPMIEQPFDRTDAIDHPLADPAEDR